MAPRSRPLGLGAVALLLLGAGLTGAVLRARSCGRSRDTTPPGAATGALNAEPATGAAVAEDVDEGGTPRTRTLPDAAAGWEEAAETVALDARRFLAGRPAAGSFEEARAEAARQDLALFPPAPARLRSLLLSPDPNDRALALAALAARPEATDELVRLVLRGQRAEEDELVRFLAAEVVAALPPAQLALREDDLLRAFEREPVPLVLAVALPALERMEEPRLRALLEAQLALAAPEMIPVLVAVARDRLGPGALREVGVLILPAEPDRENFRSDPAAVSRTR